MAPVVKSAGGLYVTPTRKALTSSAPYFFQARHHQINIESGADLDRLCHGLEYERQGPSGEHLQTKTEVSPRLNTRIRLYRIRHPSASGYEACGI